MTTMQRWELSAFGRENLSLVSVPRPVPGADEVLVEVEAVSLNFRDSLIMENRLGWRARSVRIFGRALTPYPFRGEAR